MVLASSLIVGKYMEKVEISCINLSVDSICLGGGRILSYTPQENIYHEQQSHPSVVCKGKIGEEKTCRDLIIVPLKEETL